MPCNMLFVSIIPFESSDVHAFCQLHCSSLRYKVRCAERARSARRLDRGWVTAQTKRRVLRQVLPIVTAAVENSDHMILSPDEVGAKPVESSS